MAFPADYYLPAKSVVYDYPISGGIGFYRVMSEQLEGARLIINEKRSKLGLSQISAFSDPLRNLASTINTLRSKIEDCITGAPILYNGSVPLVGYLNTTTYAGGSLQNQDPNPLSGYPVSWTRATALSAIGGGVSGNWTRVPVTNPWGLAASGGSLQANDRIFKQHINELIQVANLCDAFFVIGDLPTPRQVRSGSSPGFLNADCLTGQGQAIDAWNSATWQTTSSSVRRRTQVIQNNPNAKSIFLQGIRGTVHLDLRQYSSGTPKLYLILRDLSFGGVAPSPTFFGQDRPTTADPDKYGEWAGSGIALGVDNTTGYIQYTNQIPDFASPSDTCTIGAVGWQCAQIEGDQVCVITGTNWTYHL